MKVENLRRKADWLSNDAPPWLRSKFPRIESLDWFVKSNRGALLEAGAIARLGREWFVEIELFPAVAEGLLMTGATK